ncbi:MAG: DUF3098 domain-containing protein [Bacteroidetes bacterium]|nr:MAG: DUF3098 domain-containing protein [Bacteroidota bacterium]
MNKSSLPFNKTNYIIMLIGILLIIIGFIIMANDSEQYGFGFMGLTLGPITVMVGFVVELFAITFKSKSKE